MTRGNTRIRRRHIAECPPALACSATAPSFDLVGISIYGWDSKTILTLQPKSRRGQAMTTSAQQTVAALREQLANGSLAGRWTLDPARSTATLRTKSMWGLAPGH